MNNTLKTLRIGLIIAVLAAIGFSQLPAKGMAFDDLSYSKAAKRNTVLMNSLRWNWGKAQKGWYLYVPLISKTLGTEQSADSVGFAASVAEWQREKGIRADGVVNQKTLFTFIRHWQSQRLRPIYEAEQTSLLTAPIADFYDPTRDIELLKVDRKAYKAFKKMIADADGAISEKRGENGVYLSIISSYRSPAYQKELRRKEPGANRAQLAYRSPHFTGRALDIYVGGEPVTTKDPNRAIQVKTPAYLWLVKNADKYGFYPYFYEPWHWEYVGN